MNEATRFAILVYDDVEPIDIGATYGVLSMARRAIPHLEFYLVAAQRGPVRLTNDLVVEAHHGYADAPPAQVLVVTGGPGWRQQCDSPETLQFVRDRARTGLVASVCTGGMILAAAGLLDGRKATTRRCGVAGEPTPLELMRAGSRGIQAVDALIVDNGAVVTGGGVTLGIDTMLYLLERFFGPAPAVEVARLMEYTNARNANAGAMTTYAG